MSRNRKSVLINDFITKKPTNFIKIFLNILLDLVFQFLSFNFIFNTMNIKSSQDLVAEANKSIKTLDAKTVKSMHEKMNAF